MKIPIAKNFTRPPPLPARQTPEFVIFQINDQTNEVPARQRTNPSQVTNAILTPTIISFRRLPLPLPHPLARTHCRGYIFQNWLKRVWSVVRVRLAILHIDFVSLKSFVYCAHTILARDIQSR
jgi:hypothetical protein